MPLGMFVVVIFPVLMSAATAYLIQIPLSSFLVGFFLGLIALFGTALFWPEFQLECFGKAFAAQGVAQLLIGGGGAALVGISFAPECLRVILYLVSVVAVNDIAAYFVGSRIGGPKLLAPAISPKKTLSGSAAGIVVGTLAGVCLGRILDLGSIAALLGISIQIILAAQVGDLLKSYLKRLYGI